MHDFSGMDMGAPPIRVTRAGLVAELAGLRKRVAILRNERKEKQRQVRLKEAEQLRFRINGLLRRINQIEKALKTMDKRRPPPRRRPPPPPVRTRLRAPIPVRRPPPVYPDGRPVIPLSHYTQPSPFREGQSGGPTGPGTEEVGPSAPFPSEGRLVQEIEEMEAGQGQSASSSGRAPYRASEQEVEAGGAASAPAPSIWQNPLVWGLGILGVGAAIYFGTKGGDATKPDTGRKGAGGAGGAGSADTGRGAGSADAGAVRGAGSADTGAGRSAGRSAGTSGAGA